MTPLTHPMDSLPSCHLAEGIEASEPPPPDSATRFHPRGSQCTQHPAACQCLHGQVKDVSKPLYSTLKAAADTFCLWDTLLPILPLHLFSAPRHNSLQSIFCAFNVVNSPHAVVYLHFIICVLGVGPGEMTFCSNECELYRGLTIKSYSIFSTCWLYNFQLNTKQIKALHHRK